MKARFILIVIAFTFSKPHSVYPIQGNPIGANEILGFCQNNGLKYLTFVTINKSFGLETFSNQLTESAQLTQSIRTRSIRTNDNGNEENQLWDRYHFDQDTLVFISSSNSKEWDHYLKLISQTKIKSSILIVIEPITKADINRIYDSLSLMSENIYFYLCYIEDISGPMVEWKKLITLKHNPQVVSNKVHFEPSGKMIEEYDMQGLHVKCSTLSWAPYLSLSDCDENTGKDCKSTGYIADVMNLLGSSLNFTWSCDAEPNNDWGVTPISGPSNVNGTWGGVVGAVVNGDYPLCLSFWTNTYSRIGMMDFVIMGQGVQYVMALVPQLPRYDTGLFIRPLTRNVWLVIGLISLIVIACVIVSAVASKPGKTDTSIRIVKSIAWLTLFLVMVHYEGALTMFFTTEITVPFETRMQALLAYPEWRTMIRKGNDRNFKELAEEGIPVYIDFWNRLQETPEETYYGSIKNGIDLIRNEQVIIHISGKALRQYFKSNPYGVRPKTFPSEGENLAENLVITNNSPLGPILTLGCVALRETGIMGTLDTKWMGADISNDGGGGATALQLMPGQVMMIFAVLCTAIGVVLVVLAVEKLMNISIPKAHQQPTPTPTKIDVAD